MTIREQQEALEHEILSPRATFADETRGRERPEEECPMRTPFQRDRDRILHCNAFRRLTHKTQVFLYPEGDHYPADPHPGGQPDRPDAEPGPAAE